MEEEEEEFSSFVKPTPRGAIQEGGGGGGLALRFAPLCPECHLTANEAERFLFFLPADHEMTVDLIITALAALLLNVKYNAEMCRT